MKRVTTALCIAAVAAWSSAVFAQGRNFAGNWTIDTEKMAANAGAAGAAAVQMRSGSGGGGGTVVAAGGTEQRVAAGGGGAVAMTAGGRGGGGGGRGGAPAGPTVIALDATSFTVGPTAYKLDGSATTVGNGTAKAAWSGDKLVITTTTEGPNGTRVITTSWYLEGTSLVQERSIPAPDGGDPRVSKTYYKKA